MKLEEDSFLLYAAKYYDIRMAASAEEFYDDLKRFQHLKRLFKRYEEDDDLKVRLILNHLTVIYNCFGAEATPMLFFKIEEKHWHILKTFLVFLNRMPMEQIVTGGVRDTDIPLDFKIINILRNI